MEIKSTDDVFEQIFEYADTLHRLQIAKKEIDIEIKNLKQHWKENGVAVGKVAKVLNKIKARAKLSEADRLEEDILYEKLESNEKIQDNISVLNS
jgi:uncharacterized protein (UPF0335 family)